MLRIVGYRVAMAVPLILVVVLIVFFLESLVPGNPAETILGANATPAAVKELTHQLGLNHPWYVQYGDWLSGLVHGRLGTSIFTGEPVGQMLNGALGVTLSLVVFSAIVSAVVGTALGVLSAVRGGIAGRVIDVISLGGLAFPSFWVAIALIVAFAVKLHWFPATGFTSLGTNFGQWFKSLVLPGMSLSLLGIASVAKQARDSTLDVLEADFVRVLRASGLPERRVIGKHVLRNAAIPVVSALGLITTAMLGATVFVEQVFVMQGLGSIASTATTQHDIPLLLGVSLYFTIFVVVINLITDIAYGLINPRVRIS